MTPPIDAVALWTRGLVVGSMAFFLGTVGHVVADGLLPGPVLLAVLLAGTVLTTLPAMARRASALRLVTLMVGGQTAIHLGLTLTAGHRGEPSPLTPAAPTTGGLRGGLHGGLHGGWRELPTVDGRRVGSLQDAYHGTADLAPATPTLPIGHLVGDVQAHAPMMAVHLVAAALVGLWLAYGERLLWTLVELTARGLLALVRPVLPVAVPLADGRTYLADRAPAGPVAGWLTRPHSRRGPPLLLAAAAR